MTTITGFPAEDTTSSEATFTFTSSDPGSTFECFLDGLYEPCTSPKTYTGLIRGDHVFAVRATDPPATSRSPGRSTSGRSASA